MIAIISTLQLLQRNDWFEWHLNNDFYLNFFPSKHIQSTYEQTFKVEKKNNNFFLVKNTGRLERT